MKIKFFNNQGQQVYRELEEGKTWEECMTSNKVLNSIFKKVDNGDGIISQTEIDSLNRIIKDYDDNGNGVCDSNELEDIAKFEKGAWNYFEQQVDVAEQLYKDIFAKNSLGFPTTGKHIAKHISDVTADNVWTVLQVYNDKTDGEESLFSGIMGEIGLNIDDRIKYARHIFEKLKELYERGGVYADDLLQSLERELQKQKSSWTPANAKNIDRIVKQLMRREPERPETSGQNVAPNGKIDNDFKQGRAGDCWLLASIKAIANTPKGLKILNDSVRVNKDGSVTVTLKGKNKTYTFTRDEINRSSHLSTGDLDVRAIEMAVNRYITEEGGLYSKDNSVDIRGGFETVAFEILTGKKLEYSFMSDKDIEAHPERYYKAKITDEQIDNFNTPNHIACVCTSNKSEMKVEATDGSEGELVSYHSYAVIRSDSKYVYLVNPWDTSKELRVDRKTFKEFFSVIREMDL